MLARKLAGWLCLAPAATALAVAFRSPAWLVSHVLPDDALYYFQMARNAVAGHGVSLDGIHLTNGFHPLWMVILVGLGKLLPDAAVLPAALLLGGACGAATLWLVRKLLIRWEVSGGWLLVCISLLALNPWLALQWVNGLETAVACVLLIATWLYADYMVRINALYLRQAVVVSILASVAALGRTDFAVALLPLMVYLWCKIWRASEKKLFAALGYGLLMLGVGAAIQMPWLAWNWHVFGTLVQSSGASFSFVHHQLLYNAHANDLITNIKGSVLGVWNSGKLVLYAFASPLLYVVVLLLAALARRRSRLSFRLPAWGVAGWAGVGLLLLFGVHGAVRWAYRSWYAAPLVIAVALAIGYCSRELPKLALPKYLVPAIAVLGLASFGLAVPKYLSELAPQSQMHAVASWINQNVKADEKVGAFNSGIYAYYSGRTVVNLDGLVNNDAAVSLRARELDLYAWAAGITYLVDNDKSLDYRYAWAWGSKPPAQRYQLVNSFEQEPYSPIRVYKLQ